MKKTLLIMFALVVSMYAIGQHAVHVPAAAPNFGINLQNNLEPDVYPITTPPAESDAMTFLIINHSGFYSTGSHAPGNSYKYQRKIYLITPAEMAASGFPSGSDINSIGWELYLATGATTQTGTLKIYLMNTNDATNTLSTTWSTAITGFTMVSNNPSWTVPLIPGTTTVNFTGGSAFTYSGGGVYVAWEFENPGTAGVAEIGYLITQTLTTGALGARSTTAMPATLATSVSRPMTYFGNSSLVDIIAVTNIYALEKYPLPFGNPSDIGVSLVNFHTSAATFDVTVTVKEKTTSAVRYTSTQTGVTVAAEDTSVLTFTGWNPTITEQYTITASTTVIPNDFMGNNTKTIEGVLNTNLYGYTYNTSSISTNFGYNTGSGIFAAKFMMNGAGTITGANAVIGNYSTNTGNVIYLVLMNSAGTILTQSDNYTILATDLGLLKSFTFPTQVTFSNENFYVGLAQTANAVTGYYPMGAVDEDPLRAGTFYETTLAGGTLFEVGEPYKYLIEASVIPPPACAAPSAPTVANITINSAQIGWSGPAVVELDYGSVGHTAGTGTLITPVVNNPYTLSSLIPGTGYDVYLRQNCGGGVYSTWTGPVTFSTLPILQVTPNPFNYGTMGIGTSTPQIFTIKNNGGVTIMIDGLYLEGTNADQFSKVDPTTYPYNLTAGNSYTVTVTFAPTSSGLKNAQLRISENETDHTTPISGTGICAAPTVPTVSSITTTSASLGWTANGTTAWEIEYGLFGFTQGSGTMITTGVTNPYLLTGLSPSTVYTFYVRGNCGNGNFSAWTGPYSFATACVPYDLPYSQNFDALPIPNLPVCWSKYSSAASPWVTASNVGAHSAPNSAVVYFNSSLPKNEWLVSPAMNVTPGLAHEIRFWVDAPGWAGTPEKLKLVMSTDPSLSALQAAPVLWDGNNLLLTDFTEFVIPFIPSGAGPYYFAWHAYSVADVDYIALDDVTIQLAPVPETLSVSGQISPEPPAYCYNASGTITVSNFAVPAGASATFISNTNILFTPNTTVANGGYMHGYISSTYCSGGPLAPVVTSAQEEVPAVLNHANFTLYPNPTNGNFTLVQKGENAFGNVKIEIYNMQGKRVLSSQMIGEKQHEFESSTLPTGLYFVKLVADDYTETIKLIKTR